MLFFKETTLPLSLMSSALSMATLVLKVALTLQYGMVTVVPNFATPLAVGMASPFTTIEYELVLRFFCLIALYTVVVPELADSSFWRTGAPLPDKTTDCTFPCPVTLTFIESK